MDDSRRHRLYILFPPPTSRSIWAVLIILDVRRLLRMLLPLLYAPFLVAARWVRRFCKWRFCMWAICKWAFCKWAFCKTLRKVRPGHVHSGLVRGFAPPVHVAMRIALPGLLSTAMARQHLNQYSECRAVENSVLRTYEG